MTKRTAAAYGLTERLRAVLLEHFATVPVDELATALAYELASMIATHAPTVEAAVEVINTFAEIQADPIRGFGVGKPHP